MEYFPKHNPLPSDMVGIIDIQPPYYNSTKILVTLEDGETIELHDNAELNRALHLDKVSIREYESNRYMVTNIIEMNKLSKTIVGILDTTSKIKYGFTKKSVPIYIFRPTDSRYPPFYVASKTRMNKMNVYAIIEYSKWENRSKYPNGNCLDIIGNINEEENEYQHLLWLYHLQYPNLNHKYKKVDIPIIPTKDRVDLRDLPIMSIDPEGCKDIDDAFHYLEISKDHYQLGIHIADVSHFIEEDSELDKKIQERLTSVYAPHKTVNMLPNIYSDNICSLLPNQDRYAFSLLVDINSMGEILDYQFIKTIIHSGEALSYQQVNKRLDNRDNYLYSIYNLTQKIIEKQEFVIDKNGESKSGEMIQIMMILANKLAAEFIYKNTPDYSILRTHIREQINSKLELTNDLESYLYLVNMNSANYELTPKNNRHETLNLDYYTHFTSPIRRYIDIIIHRCIFKIISQNKNILYDKQTIQNIIEMINRRQKDIKKMDRKINKLKLIYTLVENSITTKAYIISLDVPKIEIYIPKFSISIKYRIFNSKLDNLIDYEIVDNERIEIIIKNTKDRKILELYQLITIVLTSYRNKELLDNKLKIDIIEPNLMLEY